MFRRIKNFVMGIESQFVLLLIAVALSVTSVMYTYHNQRRVKIEFGDNFQTEDAEFLLERANDATQTADTILSWLEGASVLIGIVVVVGGWLLRRYFQEEIEDLRRDLQESVASSSAFVEQARKSLESREGQVRQLEQDLQQSQRELNTALSTRIEESVQANRDRFTEIQDRARDNFRVLSLQLLAEQQVRARNIETAIKTLQSAIAIDSGDHASNYLLGYLYTSRKQIDLALDHLGRALESDPDFAPAIAAYGLALRRQGDKLTAPEQVTERNRLWAQAEDKLLQALQMDPQLTDADNESYYGTLGGLYRRQGRYDDALAAYEQAHAVTPDSSYPVINLASLHKHKGNDNRADHFFHMVIEKADLTLDDDPRDAWTRCDRAQALLVLGQKQEAFQEIETVIGQKPGSTVLETVRDGLIFLRDAPSPINGLDEMIATLNAELTQRRTQEMSQLSAEDTAGGDDKGNV